MVLNGSADMAASWITISKERSKNVSFTFPYYDLAIIMVYKPQANQVVIQSKELLPVMFLDDYAATSVAQASKSKENSREQRSSYTYVTMLVLTNGGIPEALDTTNMTFQACYRNDLRCRQWGKNHQAIFRQPVG